MAATTALIASPKSSFSIVSAILSPKPNYKAPEPARAPATAATAAAASKPAATAQITFHALPDSSFFSLVYPNLALPPTPNEQWAAFKQLKNVKIYSSRNLPVDLFPDEFLQTLDSIDNALNKIPDLQKRLNGPVPGWEEGFPKKNIITNLAQDVIHKRAKLEVLQCALQLGADPSNTVHNDFFPGATQPLTVILLQYAYGLTNPQNDAAIELRYRQVVHTLLQHNGSCHASKTQKDAIIAKAFPKVDPS